jgi:hypothetical protein
MSLLLVTWIPVVISGDTERNGLICPDCVISLTSELLIIEIRISLLFAKAMSYILTGISLIVMILSSIITCLRIFLA